MAATVEYPESMTRFSFHAPMDPMQAVMPMTTAMRLATTKMVRGFSDVRVIRDRLAKVSWKE